MVTSEIFSTLDPVRSGPFSQTICSKVSIPKNFLNLSAKERNIGKCQKQHHKNSNLQTTTVVE
jgi:hypothetical protein